MNKDEYIINLTAQYTLHSAQKVMSATSEKPACMIESEVKHIDIKIRNIVFDRAVVTSYNHDSSSTRPRFNRRSTAIPLSFND